MRASGVVLRGAGVRVHGVRVLHVLAVRARHVRVAGRAREAAGRGMTARGPGAPAAAAALPPRAPRVSRALPNPTPALARRERLNRDSSIGSKICLNSEIIHRAIYP